MSDQDTRDLILDAAEEVFASRGYHGASVRTITSKAGVNIAAINYHFGSKEALFEAVFRRRATPINDARCERLQAILDKSKKSGRKPNLKEVVSAFVEPTLQAVLHIKTASALVGILHQPNTEDSSRARKVFMETIKPSMIMYLDALGQALPEIDKDELRWRVIFSVGTFMTTMHFFGGMFEGLTTIMPKNKDIDSVAATLVSFIVGGMEAGKK